ncbi:hypothetical protein I79_004944 [Cricetulus griseus]|uniref:Uncharacterized protein n=1 Tax=Cricetulus griseus TaxID=10029 RepID=G3H3V4_CRIGR|nr:hypothetical protein I79_004944 [Cricetulus griseus]
MKINHSGSISTQSSVLTRDQEWLFLHMCMFGGHPGTVDGQFSFAVFFRMSVGPKCPYEAVVQDKSVRGREGYVYLHFAVSGNSTAIIS